MKLRKRLWILMSQAVNALFFSGDPDESLSARAWRQRHHDDFQRMHQRIDRWLGHGHCMRAHDERRKRHEARE